VEVNYPGQFSTRTTASKWSIFSARQHVNIANGTLESVSVEQRRMVFDEFIVPSMTEADSSVKVTMQDNGEFLFHWESDADKDAFIVNWSEGEEL
jgi:hypothetical protein